MIKNKDEKEDAIQEIIYGRDEMNLAEFPIAVLGKRKPGQKTLVFLDKVYDESAKTLVPRTLTITASDAYGLPTSSDEEVILAAIQLSAKNNFEDSTLYFTRYEFLKLLNWTINDVNYKRLGESLKRWTGITLNYDKAWWDKSSQSWTDATFHIIEHALICASETRKIFRTKFPHDPYAGLCQIKWNDIIFKSFQAGNIKRLDFDFYRKLNLPTSKRMYRFLDKRFYKRDSLELELSGFARDHLGLCGDYFGSKLKEKLRPAIAELEEKGFLEPLPESQRFYSVSRGKNFIVLKRSTNSLMKPQAKSSLPQESNCEDEGSPPIRIVPKPVQEVTKEDLTAYCKKVGIKWRP
ncbi:replication initiator protein A [Nostoc linckia FACHB-104]|nr:replication initiator protein A [Nostoc linckia FACHB-104]